jgi:hypothetical protein
MGVGLVARSTAAVLSHPAVKQAAANIIVLAMNQFILQPDLDQKLLIMSETMAKQQGELARRSGEDFPKLVGSFMQGMVSPIISKRGSVASIGTHSGGKEEKDDEALASQTPLAIEATKSFFGLRSRVNSIDKESCA